MGDPKPKPGKSFNVSKYNSTTKKLGRQYKRSSKQVVLPGITPGQRSSNELTTTRVPKATKFKPMSMTYGSTSGNKGVTRTVSKKKAF